MFTRFTSSARRVMQRAFREAKRCQHDFVGTEHLLYGLYADPNGPAVTLLHALGLRPELMIEKVEVALDRHEASMALEQFPLSPACKRAFEMALDEAAAFNHQMIGPEHLLLGLLRERDCEAAQILSGHGVTLALVRAAVARIPPDTYHDAQVRALEKGRVPTDEHPTAEDLEDWLAPIFRQDSLLPSAVAEAGANSSPLPTAIETQLRRTQLFLGGFVGYLVGQWLLGWEAGVVVGIVGVALAFINNPWTSVLVCWILSTLLLHLNMTRDGGVIPIAYLAAIPLSILFGTFLSDLWRSLPAFTYLAIPVQPSGIYVGPETLLPIGSLVIVKIEGRWSRARVIALEGDDEVLIRLAEPYGTSEHVVPRGELQLPA